MKHKYPHELYFDKVWKRQRRIYWLMDVAKLPLTLLGAVKVAGRKVTYFPERPRKGYLRRLADNLWWSIRNLEVNKYYYSYGLDIKNFRKAKDYMSYREFKLNREGAHYLYPDKYRFSGQILLRDKYIFGCYFSEALGSKYVPKLIGLMQDGKIQLHDTKTSMSIDEFLQEDRRFFCKLLDGECADAAFLIESKGGELTNGGKPISRDEFKKAIANATMIVQEVVEQHEAINKLNPHCVNTIRIITMRGNSGKIYVFAASIRIGTSKDSFVDNRAVGGSAVGIDENGRLKEFGFQHEAYGTRIDEHPVTKMKFKGYQLPYWDEVVRLVTDAHRAVINVQTVGWDVAITPENPILIEGNDNWELPNPQDAHGGLKKRWYELVNDEE